MDLLLILTYGAFCIGVFKIFKIPLNKWTVPTAVLGGVLLIGSLILLMNYNHPYSESTREYFITTPVVPTVTGRVIEVVSEGNQELKKGDVLFRLDPTPFKNKVLAIQAQIVSAEKDLERTKDLLRTGAGTKRNVDLAQANFDNLSAQLATEEYNLSETTFRAPTDGFVTQLTLRPGARAASLPLRPVMVFVHKNERHIIGWYRQNNASRLTKDAEAEVAFDAIPGKVFSGTVAQMLPVIAEGQLQASGNLINMQGTSPGRIPVTILIDDPEFEAYRDQLPSGAYAQSAIYTEHFHHVAIMRKVLLRMSSWMNYLFPFH